MWEKTLGLPKPLCISPQLLFFCFQIFNLHNKELTVKPVNRIRKRIRRLQESPTFFFKVFKRDQMRGKVKSRSVSRTQLKPRWVSPSWCRGCCTLRGKSLDRRRWPAVMGLPSAVHVHSHGSSYTEIVADEDDNMGIPADSRNSIFLLDGQKSGNRRV